MRINQSNKTFYLGAEKASGEEEIDVGNSSSDEETEQTGNLLFLSF